MSGTVTAPRFLRLAPWLRQRATLQRHALLTAWESRDFTLCPADGHAARLGDFLEQHRIEVLNVAGHRGNGSGVMKIS